MAITIPKEYYVGKQYRKAADEYIVLGFATPSEKRDTAFNKRKETVDRWSKNLDYYCRDKGEIESEYIVNVPVEGFRISESVRRSSSWNGGNVLWRIADPRGFELEISSANLASIIELNGIEKGGYITGKCCYGRSGSDNVLLPENSEPYIDAVRVTDNINNKKYTLKSLKEGDIITTKGKHYDMQYLGEYYILGTNINYNSEGDSVKLSKEKHKIFKRIDCDIYEILKSPTIIDIKENLPFLTRVSYIYIPNEDSVYDAVLLKEKPSSYKLKLIPANGGNRGYVFFKEGNDLYRVRSYYVDNLPNEVDVNLVHIMNDTKISYTSHKLEYPKNSYYGTRTYDSYEYKKNITKETVFYMIGYDIS